MNDISDMYSKYFIRSRMMATTQEFGLEEVYTPVTIPEPEPRTYQCKACECTFFLNKVLDIGTCPNCGAPVRLPEEPKLIYPSSYEPYEHTPPLLPEAEKPKKHWWEFWR